jgi:queuine tRNA-ribosyltransferase
LIKIMGRFEIISRAKDCNGRRGRLYTAHGQVETPVFMPVGTRGTVKGLTPRQLEETGSEILLANTYHLLLRPGVEIVEQLGGLHKVMGWAGPILTDSGGYQLFSLSSLNRIGDEGVQFCSHIDGAKMYLDAKTATEAQNRLGADIIMCFDECADYPCEQGKLEKAVERTLRWAGECKEAHSRAGQMLFGIVQGGVDRQLREYCADELCKLNFDGYAIGGLSVGEGHDRMVATVEYTARLLPEDKPRYLMGVGMPADIIAAVRSGVDMFDCVLPTRNGRNAFAFTSDGPVRLRNNTNISDSRPIEADCGCYCCRNFGRGALRHFFNVGEMLGPILVSIHNLTFYQRLMSEIRQRIEAGAFSNWARQRILEDKFATVDMES